MEQAIRDRVKRLQQLGYRSFQIKMIFREAIGVDNLNHANSSQRLKVVAALQKYEQLGSTYIETYSK